MWEREAPHRTAGSTCPLVVRAFGPLSSTVWLSSEPSDGAGGRTIAPCARSRQPCRACLAPARRGDDRASGSRSGEAMLVGEDDGLRAAVEVELGQHVGDVLLDGAALQHESRARSALESPRAMSRSTSCSRGVSVSTRMSGSGRGLLAANSLMSRRVTSGAMRPWPRATVRTASISTSGSADLRRKPAAPARSASKTTSSRSKVVTTRTSIGGPSPDGEQAGGRDAVHPRHPDVHQHELGVPAVREATASTPSLASPTTSISGSARGSCAVRGGPPPGRPPAGPG